VSKYCSGRPSETSKNRRYYWTEHNRRMRLVDLCKVDIGGDKVRYLPLDQQRREDVQDRTSQFLGDKASHDD